jgi:putative flippase GtrA
VFIYFKNLILKNLLKIFSKFENNKDLNIFRFLLVGFINTLIGFLLFPMIYWGFSAYRKNYVGMLVVSQLICMMISFFTNKVYVFRSKNKAKTEMLKFGLFHGFYFLVNIKINPLIVNTSGMNPIIVQTFINVFIVLTTFFWYDKIVFPSNKLIPKIKD